MKKCKGKKGQRLPRLGGEKIKQCDRKGILVVEKDLCEQKKGNCLFPSQIV